MRIRTRSTLLLVGLAAAALSAIATSTAFANRLSVTEQQFEITWAALVFATTPANISCPATLLGRFHARTMPKVSRMLVGSVTHADLGRCEFDGAATFLRETLPWHVTYNSFVGSLPLITHVVLNIVGAAFRAGDEISCLTRTDVTEPAVMTAVVRTANNQIATLNANAEREIDIDDTGGLCPLVDDMSLSGSGRVTTPAGGLLFLWLI